MANAAFQHAAGMPLQLHGGQVVVGLGVAVRPDLVRAAMTGTASDIAMGVAAAAVERRGQGQGVGAVAALQQPVVFRGLQRMAGLHGEALGLGGQGRRGRIVRRERPFQHAGAVEPSFRTHALNFGLF